jgi:hypothetical protein
MAMRQSHQLIEFRRDNRDRLNEASIGLFPAIPKSREGKTCVGPELEVDRKLLLAVSPFVKTVGPIEQITLYEVSPMP